MLRFRKIISAAIVAIMMAGSVPSLACARAICAANAKCAMAHCGCCGPYCPLSKDANKLHASKAGQPQCCLLVAANDAVTLPNAHSLSIAILGAEESRSFLIGDVSSTPSLIRPSISLQPPTLLGLACALTI